MTSLIGQERGNYRLTQLLGQGGFAEVYLGEHIHLGSKAAVKVLYTRLDEKGIQQFKQEAVTLTNLPHPHIIRIIDFGFDNDIPYLIMEFAPGGTLTKRHPLGIAVPIATLVGYIKQVAEALQYAHTNNIIHRDIKPENMLIGQNDTILLSDFGIARVVQAYSVGTAHITGSFQYMAPEQGAGKAVFASDQYSLGVVAYQWLCGNRPFEGDSQELMFQHYAHTPPPFPPQLRIPSAIENVVMKALSKKPQQRFATVQEFASTLEQTSRGTPFQVPVAQSGASNQGRTSTSSQQQSTQPSTVNDIDALYRQGVEAYAKRNLEQTEQLWQQVLTMDPNYGNGTLAPRMTKLRAELHPIRVRRLREQALTHSKAGEWNQEIECWNNLLTLKPEDSQAKERRSLAQHNMQYAWMYTTAQQFVREGKLDAAKTELTTLWREAPYYGDPAGLAPKVGLKAPVDYEQDKLLEQKRQSIEEQEQQRREQEQQRRQSIEKQEQQRRQSIEEQEQQRRQSIEKRKQDRVSFVKIYLGVVPFVVWLCIFMLLGGLGVAIGMIASYWTTSSWIIAVISTVILAPIAYVLGYRKATTPFPMIVVTLLSTAAVFGLTWYLSKLPYSHSEISNLWIVGNRTLWIGRQFTFGIVIGVSGFIGTGIIASVAEPSDLEELLGPLFGAGVWAIFLWLVGGIVALFFGWIGGQWGWGFGFGWYFTLLSMAIICIAGIGVIASIYTWVQET